MSSSSTTPQIPPESKDLTPLQRMIAEAKPKPFKSVQEYRNSKAFQIKPDRSKIGVPTKVEDINEVRIDYDPSFREKCCNQSKCSLIMRHGRCFTCNPRCKVTDPNSTTPNRSRTYCDHIKNIVTTKTKREKNAKYKKGAAAAPSSKGESSKASAADSESAGSETLYGCDICCMISFIDQHSDIRRSTAQIHSIAYLLRAHYDVNINWWEKDDPVHTGVEINGESFVMFAGFDSSREIYEFSMRGRLHFLQWDLYGKRPVVVPSQDKRKRGA